MQVPSKACDCHVHVFGPPARYPFAERVVIVHRRQRRPGLDRGSRKPPAVPLVVDHFGSPGGWVGDPALFRKILVDNPARLYDF